MTAQIRLGVSAVSVLSLRHMPKEFSRTARVGSQIQRELAGLIRDEIRDPRLGLVTVQAVKVARDLAHARVYYTLLGEIAERADSQLVLDHAAGYLRAELGHRLRMRSVPRLHFVYDESVERGEHLDALIERTRAADDAGDR